MVATEPIDGQTRRRLATRERLYQAAVALITERGYEATTVDEIAARARTSRRSCFNHFPTKSDITIEWARRRREQAMAAAQEAVSQGATDVLDRLRAYFHELAVITEARPVETREMLFGYLRACGPVLNRTPMAEELQMRLADDGTAGTDSGIDLAAEILHDVYQGVLWRWMRNDPAPPGAFTTELDAAIDITIQGVAASFTTGQGKPPHTVDDFTDRQPRR
ncbi:MULTISPECIES: TetR/AcrR family transcriptional regulator [Actinomadura]|uniref:DNA-binding transcriptional regulator, AcrR family n=1 Tax=Actinomadura madurae TaxID=1993 RepID=A0A1I5PNH3_9ACTN|nr:TetR/AcrR family transcriptional regulator [Actinomadura madurae]SFP35613.1 DNA-binding transcriptional regulator, AcrR family [Actinomadura madurae]SPT63995.1 Fatty acid metabolism regulator protein [Actinomadura madurae]